MAKRETDKIRLLAVERIIARGERVSTTQIRAELNWMLQRSEGWFIRIVYGFVKKLYEQFDAAEEMQKAA